MKEPVSSSSETGSGSPGSVLRRCREFHKITLEEASETTKIGISHLKALEGDQIDEFANIAYLKGFIRIYATYLGLNSEDIARMYTKLFGVQGQGDKTDPAGISSPINHPKHSRVPLKRLLFPALLLLVILVTATYFKEPPPLVRQPQAAAIIAPSVQSPVVQSVQSSARSVRKKLDIPAPKVETRSSDNSIVEKIVPPKRSAVVAKGGFIVKVKVTHNGALTVTVDDTAAQPYELSTGDIIEWKAEKKVALELNDRGAIDVELNGKPYKSLGTSGKPLYVEINTDALEQ